MWFGRITGIVTFALGSATFIYETLFGGNLAFAALALGIMGVPLGKAVENLLTWITSLRPIDKPEPKRKP